MPHLVRLYISVEKARLYEGPENEARAFGATVAVATYTAIVVSRGLGVRDELTHGKV